MNHQWLHPKHRSLVPSPTPGDRDHQECIHVATYHLLGQIHHQEEAVADNPLNHHNLRFPQSDGQLLRHPALPKAPTPPIPWVLIDRNVAPYDDFKPKILKEVDNFKGDSNDISWFFLKCELHFELFNRHFWYPSPQSNLLHLTTC